MRAAIAMFVSIELLALAAPAAADTLGNLVEKAAFEIQPPTGVFKRVTIDNPLGDVVVEGYDGKSIKIETKKSAPDEEGLERLRISLVPNPDGTVRLSTTADKIPEHKQLKRGVVRIDIKVIAPRDVRVEATASSGRVAISNMDNGGELDTSSGLIEVTNVSGELSTHSVNGATTINQVFGSVDSQTLDANLAFDSISGERLIASANHGKISGRRVRSREVQLTTNHGNITLEAEASLRGRVVVASLNGNIEVKMRRHTHAILARAHAAKVNLGGMTTTSQPDGWREARVGQASDKALPMLVEMRSRIGNVQLVFVD